MGGYVQNGAALISVPPQLWFLGVSVSLCRDPTPAGLAQHRSPTVVDHISLCHSPGTFVTRAEATDADDPETDNAALRFSILEQGSPEFFSIDEHTGEIRTVQVGLDREVRQPHGPLRAWGAVLHIRSPHASGLLAGGVGPSHLTAYTHCGYYSHPGPSLLGCTTTSRPQPVAYAWEMPSKLSCAAAPGDSYPYHRGGSTSQESAFYCP